SGFLCMVSALPFMRSRHSCWELLESSGKQCLLGRLLYPSPFYPGWLREYKTRSSPTTLQFLLTSEGSVSLDCTHCPKCFPH
uniref:Uncharacterized protein n=1 Tax=Gopherus agassizii TaxID=38772 RepID=A0A452GM36_9SAUR